MADIERSRRDAVTLLYAMSIFTEGGNVADIVQHLYTPDEVKKLRIDIESQKEKDDDLATSIELLDALKYHAKSRGMTINE